MRTRTRLVGIVTVGCAALLAGCSSSASPAATTLATTTTSAGSTTTTSPPGSPTSTAPGSTTTTTAIATPNFDSCSVVTRSEAGSAIGQSVTAGVLGHATVEGGLACVFYGPSAPTPTVPDVPQADSVRVVVVKGPDASRWYDDYKAKVNAQAVSGYGDQAYYDGFASLSVLKGDYYLRIAISPPGAPPSLSDEKQLAAAILPKL